MIQDFWRIKPGSSAYNIAKSCRRAINKPFNFIVYVMNKKKRQKCKEKNTRRRGGSIVAKGGARGIKGERRRCVYVCLIAIEYSVWRGHAEREKERAPSDIGRSGVESPRRVLRRPTGRYVIFSLAFPFPGLRHRCGVPIKCCSPYKISPWRGHVLMNYRVRPRDRSNYIERPEPRS